MMDRMTSVGLSEHIECVLAYVFFWISGLFFLIFEKNPRVRAHALQSTITFGTLTIVSIVVDAVKSILSHVFFLGWFTDHILGFFSNMLGWAIILLWIWLIVMAVTRPNYRLPYLRAWIRF